MDDEMREAPKHFKPVAADTVEFATKHALEEYEHAYWSAAQMVKAGLPGEAMFFLGRAHGIALSMRNIDEMLWRDREEMALKRIEGVRQKRHGIDK